MWERASKNAVIPARGQGTTPDFNSAREAALAWRPGVRVIDGIELWLDPISGKGEAVDLNSGELTWRAGVAAGSRILWSFEPAGLGDVFQAWGCWRSAISGACDTLEQMLAEVNEARDRIRSAMRKFLRNY